MTTRRDFLKYALLSGAAAGSASVLPSSIQRAFAIAPDIGSTWKDAEHIVILMQENRSFDHVFGTLQGVRGFNDPRAMRQPDGVPVFAQTGKSGKTYLPWRLNIKDTRVTWMGSIPHSRDSQVDAWNDGGHDQWIDAKKSHHKGYGKYPLTMGYYTREDLPFYYALADAFTVCDQNYCGAMTGTSPNRLLFMTGTVRNQQDVSSKVYMRNDEILEGGMTWTTFPERLEKADISWKYYQNELTQTGGMSEAEDAWLSNFSTNILECFDQYCVSANPGFGDWLEARISECQNDIEQLHKREMLTSESHNEQLTEARALLAVLLRRRSVSDLTKEKLSDSERNLFEKAFVINSGDNNYRKLEGLFFNDGVNNLHMQAPKGDVLYQFRQDVKAGKLPTVSWLSAPEHFSDHPSSPWYGAWYVSEVMDILTENPEVWKKTIFIITYDENDGYFDHCPSYTAPDPKRPETGRSSASIGPDGLEYTTDQDEMDMGVPSRLARTGPIGLGFRVPMIVASPWSRGGWVNSQLFEHTSTLRFLESFIQEKFGKTVRETNISPWRRAISGNLTSCFRPYDGSIPTLPYLNRDAHLHMIEGARDQPMPGGFRPLTATEVSALRTFPTDVRNTIQQESGTRPSCALPYEPYCDGSIEKNGGTISLHLQAGTKIHGNHAAGLPFNVYYHDVQTASSMQAATYAVAAGDTLNIPFDTSSFKHQVYDVSVHAPNGFYRGYKGQLQGPQLHIQSAYLLAKKKDFVLRLTNRGTKPANIISVLKSQGGQKMTTLQPGQSTELAFDLTKSSMWYDVVLTSPDDSDFLWHFAGRVETRKPGETDPAMGNVYPVPDRHNERLGMSR